MPSLRTASRQRLQVVEAAPTHRGVREERRRGIVVRPRGAQSLSFQSFVPDAIDARRIAEVVHVDRPTRRDPVGQMLQPDLVLEVVLVEKGGLDHPQVLLPCAFEGFGVLIEDVVLEDHRLDAGVFRQLHEVEAPGRTLEVVERGRKRRSAREPFLLDDDREAEVDGEDHTPDGPVVVLDEVVECGHHAVARTALDLGVEHRRVEPAVRYHLAPAGSHPLLHVRLTVLLGDPLRRVVQVAPAVRPADVVQDHDRQRRALLAGHVGEELQLVADRVPVVVAVDQRRVHDRELPQHVEAGGAVEHVPAGKRTLVLGRVELGHGVDDVELGLGTELLEHAHGGLASERADLDDPLGFHRPQDRGNCDIPEREHPVAPPEEAARYQRGVSVLSA